MTMPRSKWFWIGVAVGALACFCTFGYQCLDMAVAERIRSLPGGNGWIRAGKWFSDWGKGEYYAVPAGLAGMAVFWFWRRNLKRFYYSLFAVVAVAGAGLLNSGLKFVFGRARPPRVWPDSSYEYGFHLFRGAKAAWQSFPSGHCISAAAAATVLWFLLPLRLRPLCVLYVAVMMTSRMLAGAHFLSDVLAGAFLGVAFTLALRTVFSRHRLF